ncbi:MAG: DUF424 family protein [Methanogenium sp.]
MKIHRHAGVSEVLAVCDKELLNTTIKGEDLTLRVTEAFYGATPCTKEEVKRALEHASTCNLLGEKAVGAAIECGMLQERGCMMIGTVPHAQIF